MHAIVYYILCIIFQSDELLLQLRDRWDISQPALQKPIIAVCKYGFAQCMQFIELNKTVPFKWPDALRKKLLTELSPDWTADVHDVFGHEHDEADAEQDERTLEYYGPPVGMII